MLWDVVHLLSDCDGEPVGIHARIAGFLNLSSWPARLVS